MGTANAGTIGAVLSERVSPDWHWRGMHPFYEQHGAANVACTFWTPLLTAMSSVQRREDIFFANENSLDGEDGIWVVSMGHLLGLFDQPFLNIPATSKITMLRYAEFNRVLDGKIVETAMFCDLIHLMHQAGLQPLPPQTGQHLIQPGPRTHDGLHYDGAADGTETLTLINRMIENIDANSNAADVSAARDATPQEELALSWHDDMIWWGPAGIGAILHHRPLYRSTPTPLPNSACGPPVPRTHRTACRRQLRRIFRLGEPVGDTHRRLHGLARRATVRNARRRYLPAGRRQACGKLDLHRHPVFP